MALLRAATAALLTVFATCAATYAAHAAEHMVVIRHTELGAMPDATFRQGDTITFDNQADMAHNLYVTYDDGTIDNLDTQIPGTKKSVTLRRAGPAKVRCWIHPIINLDLNIAPSEGKQE